MRGFLSLWNHAGNLVRLARTRNLLRSAVDALFGVLSIFLVPRMRDWKVAFWPRNGKIKDAGVSFLGRLLGGKV